MFSKVSRAVCDRSDTLPLYNLRRSRVPGQSSSQAMQQGDHRALRPQSDEPHESSDFEKSARLLMGKFASLWLGSGDTDPHSPAAELVAIASQACATVADEVDGSACFTEFLLSNEVLF